MAELHQSETEALKYYARTWLTKREAEDAAYAALNDGAYTREAVASAAAEAAAANAPVVLRRLQNHLRQIAKLSPDEQRIHLLETFKVGIFLLETHAETCWALYETVDRALRKYLNDEDPAAEANALERMWAAMVTGRQDEYTAAVADVKKYNAEVQA